MDYEEIKPVLEATALVAAADEPLDLISLSGELERSPQALEQTCESIELYGLALYAERDPSTSPILLAAGKQYLALKGEVAYDCLRFAARAVDDLLARQALIHAGHIVVDEFRGALIEGNAVEYASEIVPQAFVPAVNEALAVDLFASTIAVLTRLSESRAAGCVAEEIAAVYLISIAKTWLDMEVANGKITEEESDVASNELRGIFELFEDDDVLRMFEMSEPADAALAGHSAIDHQAGIVDQRVEAWLRPFGWAVATGHLQDRDRQPAA